MTLGYGTKATKGNYFKYGKPVTSYQYISGDYTSTEITIRDRDFGNAHPTWTRVGSATKKYNCHSYSWINSSVSNTYWVNNFSGFLSSSQITKLGNNGAGSPRSGDKMVIVSSQSFSDGDGGYTYNLHSANYISSSLTRSKLGAEGVYDVPSADIVGFYKGFGYESYRIS